MPTLHEQGVLYALQNRSEEELAVFNKFHTLLLKGFFTREYVELFMQHHWTHGGYNLSDAYTFANLHTMLRTGEMAMVKIGARHEPYGDDCIEQNNKVLSDLPHPFVSEFIPTCGHGDNDDGYLRWTKPIRGSVFDVDGKETFVTIGPLSVPLEVGTTDGSRTLLHMRQDPGLARWPFGHSDIVVFVQKQHVIHGEIAGTVEPD